MNIGPTIKPKVSFVPLIMNALSVAAPDPGAAAFKNALGAPLVRLLTDAWTRMPGQEKVRRYNIAPTWTPRAGETFAAAMSTQSKLWTTARAELLRKRKEIIKREFDKGLIMGLGNYKPPAAILKDPGLLYDISRKFGAKLCACRCEEPGPSDPPPAVPTTKYGLKVTKLKCHDQREAGNDEIYLISAVADGKGKLVTTVSSKYSVDDGDDDVAYPNYWIYPMQDPGGFLDAAIAMREDDGGYGQAGQTVAAVGGALGTIPNPYTVGAGVALVVIGEIISLASWLDSDDEYGNGYRTWGSAAALQAGVGSYVITYYEVDEGWFDDGHDFDLTINLLTA